MTLIKLKQTAMEREILEQKEIVQKLLDIYINDDKSINIDVPPASRVVIVASGSSYHCARFSAALFGSVANIEARAIYSSEFLLETKIPNADLYVFITQSGETSDTNAALLKAKDFGAKTLCITNKENSTIWNASDYKIACHAGEEQSIAATKSLISQMLCASLLVLKYAQDNSVRDLYDIPDTIEKAIALRPKIKQIARFLSKFKNIVITADGISYSLAKEASLKIKETSYINTSSYILGEFMHGHSAMLNNPKSAIVYILNDNLSYSAINNLNKIKENYNPAIIVIGNRNNQVKSTFNINIDCEKPFIKNFGLLVIIQLLALEIALKLHRNIDKPHGLNKIVK